MRVPPGQCCSVYSSRAPTAVLSKDSHGPACNGPLLHSPLACAQMYCLLIRVEAGAEPNLRSYLVTHGVFLIGFFTLAVLLGECGQATHSTAVQAKAWAGTFALHCDT